MEDINIVAESVIKIENIKEEPVDIQDDLLLEFHSWKSTGRLTQHASEDVAYVCTCSGSFPSYRQATHLEQTLQCPKCNGSSSTKCTEASVIKTHTKRESRHMSKSSVGSRKSSKSKSTLVVHKQTDKAKTSYHCATCKEKFPPSALAKTHKLSYGDAKFQHCSKCRKNVTQKTDLNVRIHTEGKSFQCAICEKSFTQSADVRIHMRIHTGEKPYQCAICEKNFTIKQHLKRHIRIHTGEKPFRCTICKTGFSRTDILHQHMRIHSDEKVFHCNICRKSFTQKPSLRRHMRIHTDEKVFQCTFCTKSFTQAGRLETHLNIHTGDKPYQCSICEKSYTQKGNLVKHMRTHADEKPLQ